MFLKELLAVMLGGGIGASLRFILSRMIALTQLGQRYAFTPIMIVNVVGSFLIGALYIYLLKHLELGPIWRAFVFIGLLGGFTTFSSYSLDVVTLFSSGDVASSLVNCVLSVGLSIFACIAGIALARLFVSF